MSEDKTMRLLKQDFMMLWVGALLYMLGFMLALGGFEIIFLGLGLCLLLFVGVDTLRLSLRVEVD